MMMLLFKIPNVSYCFSQADDLYSYQINQGVRMDSYTNAHRDVQMFRLKRHLTACRLYLNENPSHLF